MRLSPRGRRFSWSIPSDSSGRCWRPMSISGPTGRFTSATGSRAGKSPTRGGSTASFDPVAARRPRIREVKTLLAEGMEKKSLETLAALARPCGHAGSPGSAVRAGQSRRCGLENAALKSPRPHAKVDSRESTRSGDSGRISLEAACIRRKRLASDRAACWLIRPGDARPDRQGLGEVKEPKAFDGLIGLLSRHEPAGSLLRGDFSGQARAVRGGRARSLPCSARQCRRRPLPATRRRDGAGRARASTADWKRAAHDPVAGGADGQSCWPCGAARTRKSPGFSQIPNRGSCSRQRGRSTTCRLPLPCPGWRHLRWPRTCRLPLLRRVLNANFRLGGAEHAIDAGRGRAAGRTMPESMRAMALVSTGSVGRAAGARPGDGALAADSTAAAPAGGSLPYCPSSPRSCQRRRGEPGPRPRRLQPS